MARGSRPGERRGGRKKGTPNKRTVESQQRMQEAAQVLADALGENAFEGDAHALLMAIYKDKRLSPEIRIEAAKAAAPYEKPRLSSTEHKGSVGISHEDRLGFLMDDAGDEAPAENDASDGRTRH